MKLCIFSLFCVLVSLCLVNADDDTLDQADADHISVYSFASATCINSSLDVIGAKGGDLALLVRQLSKIGFGKNPHSHPNHRDLTEEEKKKMSAKDIEAQKSYLAEARERTARMGEGDIKLLKSLDENGDLKLEKEEVASVITKRLKFLLNDRLNADKDKDGRLSLKEYCLTVPAKGEVGEDGADWHQRGHFRYEDKDKNGFLSKKEIIDYEASKYLWKTAMIMLNLKLVKADTNNDGLISEKEFYSVFKDKNFVANAVSKPKPLSFPINVNDLWRTLYWKDTRKLVEQLKER